MDAKYRNKNRSFPKDLSGVRFGRLVAVRRVDDYVSPKGNRLTRWLCLCECGQEKIVNRSSLVAGDTTNCGCKPSRGVKHGGSGTREFSSWQHMLKRCQNPKDVKWHLYGGRGVTVCERWRTSFENFRDDVGECPSPRHTLDRYPNRDGNYEPGNVRWATPDEQSRNTRRTVFLEHDGRVQCRADWSRELSISEKSIARYTNRGYTLAEIIAVVSASKRSHRYGNSGIRVEAQAAGQPQ